MTVGELKAKLGDWPDHYEVVIAVDNDGTQERLEDVRTADDSIAGHGLAVELW